MGLTALWWWIDRWRKSTAYTDMTLAEQGAYRNLLDEAQLRGGPLPDDERILAKACGDALAWPAVRIAVLAHFEHQPDGWHNATLDAVIRESERRAQNQANYRARRQQGDNGGDNGSGNGADNKSNNRPASPSPSPSPSLISGSVSDSKIKTVSSASENQTSEPAAILVFPVTGTGPKTWPLTADLLDQWTDAYPSLDVLAETRKALVWIHANRRKTARGMPRFLVAWLNRATDSGGVTRSPLPSGPTPPTRETRVHAAGQRPHVAFDADWWDECKRIHNGACEGDRMRHHLRVQADAIKSANG